VQRRLGQCNLVVPTPAGAGGAGVAAAIAAAFQSGCPADSNARDLYASGDAVLTSLATDLTICLNDPGVGATLLPNDVCTTNADCDDNNPCTTDVCTPATGLCQSTPVPDGTSCDDHNACTIGNVCTSGRCGAYPARLESPSACDRHRDTAARDPTLPPGRTTCATSRPSRRCGSRPTRR